MRQLLAQQQHQVVEQPDNADALIVCEGPAFAFAAVIDKIATNHNHQLLFIHGYNTANAVGSTAKEQQGNALLTPPPAF